MLDAQSRAQLVMRPLITSKSAPAFAFGSPCFKVLPKLGFLELQRRSVHAGDDLE
jgi:hypothetical protein